MYAGSYLGQAAYADQALSEGAATSVGKIEASGTALAVEPAVGVTNANQ